MQEIKKRKRMKNSMAMLETVRTQKLSQMSTKRD